MHDLGDRQCADAYRLHQLAGLFVRYRRKATAGVMLWRIGIDDVVLFQAAMILTRQLRKESGEPVFYSMNTGANLFIYCFSDSAHRKVIQNLNHLDIKHNSSKVGSGLKYLENNNNS